MADKIFNVKTLWTPDDKYLNHRIPGMIITDKGTILVYCEARTQVSDWALMDILLQRSEDGGESFSEPVVMAHGDEVHSTVNNPVMVQDKNKRIHFLYCEDYSINGGKVYRRYSDDDGITWSDKIDITDGTMPEYRNVFALGPGHGIMTREGALIVPVWMVAKHFNSPLSSHHPSVLSTLYSLDNGESWHTGDILESTDEINSPNETEAALTSDGTVYLGIRNVNSYRAAAYSKNGYSGWYNYRPEYKLTDPICFGSVTAYNHGEAPYSLVLVNCDSPEDRKNVTVRVSTDDGESWTLKKVIDPERGGYCESAVDEKSGLIYALYENLFGQTVHLAVFNYEWITENQI